MAGFNSFNPLKATKRHTQYSGIPPAQEEQPRDYDAEKYGHHDESDEEDTDYSSYPSSPSSSRETSNSYHSNAPILRKRANTATPRPAPKRLPPKVMRYLCLAMISTIVIFMLSLVRMSHISTQKVQDGHASAPPPPPLWESFPFLSRYYGGIRTLVPLSENKPEYPREEDELPLQNKTSIEEMATPARGLPASKSFQPYTNITSGVFNDDYAPVQECFLDRENTVRAPRLQYYEGRPSGFPNHIMGSYEVLGLPEDICFERYGRLGPYGYGYGLRYGGTGTGQHGEMEGAQAVWTENSNAEKMHSGQVDYRKVDWADAQRRCHQRNAARFQPFDPVVKKPTTFSTLTEEKDSLLLKRDGLLESVPNTTSNAADTTSKVVATPPKKYLPRTAFVIRLWDEYVWREEDIMALRALISEVSIGSGGQYDVHLLVQVKDSAVHPVFADEEIYQQHLKDCLPEEFVRIATFWSETQMLMLYQGLFDTFIRGLPVHGSYRGLQMAMQWFAHNHQEYDFFWEWEVDIRYTGHWYHFLSKIDAWTKEQPRKGLWERNSRYYVPEVHGTWEDFKQMVRVQTEIGTDNPNNMWSGIGGQKGEKSGPVRKGEKPVWGPQRPSNLDDWFETENDPVPPTSYDKDKYTWGVGEDADLIVFNPLFDPDGTTWLLADDVTGYNLTGGLPPRRATIIAAARMSRKLLNTMHRETTFMKHHAFTEMWAPTTALHHGYKAVSVPHPMFVDREWPTEYLASIMNGGRNGATGGARTSVFGDREHNLRGMTWFYNTGFAPNLWRRWLGFKVDNEGGEEFETTINEGRNGQHVNDMRGGEGRMCLPPMLLHPVKGVEIPVEGLPRLNEEQLPESDPTA
ncbi:64e011a8-c7ec-4fff-b6c4-0ccbb19d4ae9-CDS [Sclerotinia trifoliorum]|uniref:64e011a8-c7ec-4fff-b6c4-0ccbb19d4ae9-CDS n=1 Tax=Sclerotinia trifoliorum TaxID=28548 RepID=A0A8H2VZ42_9HELO|nr:64e011a8-c7ec-4fff-b6c4-0ccbb19d4ae9-CDS [Sclerotinia trifoliorum]